MGAVDASGLVLMADCLGGDRFAKKDTQLYSVSLNIQQKKKKKTWRRTKFAKSLRKVAAPPEGSPALTDRARIASDIFMPKVGSSVSS